MPEQLPADVRDLTPAARLVYLALEAGETLTVSEISNRTGLAPKSIRDCCRELESVGVVEIRTHPKDARARLYERA